ncbi:MAG: energy-coupling factor transporter transmembrane protein EcfT [Lachnospiraceae bacterium]|jgi:energy-coupling factor transport system permease protein|nr:energy-coupling factor transporter transmembrane protein EcfT [Lachnospiraceae bacterium]
MLRDITIGQYYPTESVIHRLDPRTKFLGTIIFVVSLFLFKSFWGFLLTGGFLICLTALAHIPFKYVLKGMRPMLFLLLFMMIFTLLMTPGEVLGEWWIFTVTKEGIYAALFMGLRLTMLVLGSSLMTYTTTPNKLTAGMESVFGFLKIFKVPVHELAMMISIALRFIPILLEETNKIIKAQQARGADFESGGPIKRAKAMVPILIPLFVSSFRRAGELAEAMEARCYHGGEGRTKMKPLKYAKRDLIAYLCLAGLIAGCIFIP